MPNDADRTDPFSMLRSSHRRLKERLAELAAAAGALDDPAQANDALAACEDVLGYFGRSVARHEDDEEVSLFPRLAPFAELAPALAVLAAEHKEQHKLVAELGDMVEGVRQGAPGALLADVTARLAAAYAKHIEREESELFPAAERLLGTEAIAAIAGEMAGRRGRGGGGGGGGSGGGGGGGGGRR